MDTLDDIKKRNAERSAAQRGAPAGASQLPPDASLPPDAQALRARYLTPLERLTAFAAGEEVYDGDMARMAADKAILAYHHKTPAARQEISLDDAAHVKSISDVLLDLIRSGQATPEQVRAAREALAASPDDRAVH